MRTKRKLHKDFWAWTVILSVFTLALLTLYGMHTGYLEFKSRPYHAAGFDSSGRVYYEYDD